MKFSLINNNRIKTLFVSCVIILSIISANSYAQSYIQKNVESKQKKSGDYVIILHGLAKSKYSMIKYETEFNKLGYKAYSIDYPSIEYPVSKLYNIVNEKIKNIITDESKKVNFVGFSLGAILIRMIMEFDPPKNIGRVVQIAPPNQGSEFITNLRGAKEIDIKWGPAPYQLGTGKYEIPKQLGSVKNYELGVIAGDKTINENWSYTIDGDNDGIVSVKSTKVKGMKEHYIINDNHENIINNKKTMEKTIMFIEEGTFYGF